MQYPKITVVTPSFNQAGYLEQTLCSVLGQGYPNLEYIVIDGGSTDGSVDIIRRYESQLAFWCSERDNGMYDALQKGFQRSTGAIMCWLNSDDLLHPKSLFTVAEIFSSLTGVEWLQGIPTVADESGRTVFVKNFRKWSRYHFYMEDRDHIQQESCFWKRSLWERAGNRLDASLKLAGDYELWLRFFDYAELYCTRTILGAFRARSANQLSLENMDAYSGEVKKVLTKRLAKLTTEEQRLLKRYAASARRKNSRLSKLLRRPVQSPPVPPAVLFDRKTQRFFLEGTPPQPRT